jgi:hypothetical protein
VPTELGEGLIEVNEFPMLGQLYKQVKIKGPTKVSCEPADVIKSGSSEKPSRLGNEVWSKPKQGDRPLSRAIRPDDLAFAVDVVTGPESHNGFGVTF